MQEELRVSAESREERAADLRPQVQDAVEKRSLRAVAGDIGITHPTLGSFLDGKTPAERTLEKLERWSAAAAESGKFTAASELADRDGSPAERLIYYFSHPETRRRFSDHPPMDFVKAAFAIALDEGLPQEELDKLGRWREEVRDRRQGDAPPTGD